MRSLSCVLHAMFCPCHLNYKCLSTCVLPRGVRDRITILFRLHHIYGLLYNCHAPSIWYIFAIEPRSIWSDVMANGNEPYNQWVIFHNGQYPIAFEGSYIVAKFFTRILHGCAAARVLLNKTLINFTV